ncbi:MAG: hypothetical protein SCM11_03030 [Bacillota bacterium]|nr:hypothetical protein [Bacillota bacterium]
MPVETRYQDYLRVEPCVVAAGQTTQMTIQIVPGQADPEKGFAIRAGCLHLGKNLCVLRLVGLQYPGDQTLGDRLVNYVAQEAEQTLTAELFFPREQEYQLRFYSVAAGKELLMACLAVYALESDLLACRPWKGDLHLHSIRSDGKDTPQHVAAACRCIGFDFMAVTDHRQFAPSLEAIAAFTDVPVDLTFYTGEEVHAPDNPVHIVHIGGARSINDRFDSEEYRQAIRERIAGQLPLPSDVDPAVYASTSWIFEQVAAGGGLSIFCHPYWINANSQYRQGYYINEPLTTRLMEDQAYDALEVLGGYHLFETDSNNLQLARYHEERAAGRKIPIVGVSDAHGCETGKLFGWFFTIVFSHTTELADVKRAIKDCRSVAVEALPGEVVRVHGPFRLVQYALFLLRAYFPRHDQLCRAEGDAMLMYIGESSGQDCLDQTAAAERLRQLQGQVSVLQDHLFDDKTRRRQS